MIKHNIIEQTKIEFKYQKLVKKICKKIAKKEKVKGKHYFSLILVDLNEIHNINKQYRNLDRPTDVISFAVTDWDESDKLPTELGDIFLCIDKVVEQANEYNHSIEREFAFLVSHGIYHLLGYDHLTKETYDEMISLQEAVLNELKIKR